MQRIGLVMAPSFRKIELARGKNLWIRRIGKLRLHRLCRETGKLMQEFTPALFYFFAELALVIGKISERSRSGELLSLKQHRRLRCEKEQGRNCAVERRVRHTLNPPAVTAISNLIVILQKVDECGRRQPCTALTARLALLTVSLALIVIPLREYAAQSRGGAPSASARPSCGRSCTTCPTRPACREAERTGAAAARGGGQRRDSGKGPARSYAGGMVRRE